MLCHQTYTGEVKSLLSLPSYWGLIFNEFHMWFQINVVQGVLGQNCQLFVGPAIYAYSSVSDISRWPWTSQALQFDGIEVHRAVFR